MTQCTESKLNIKTSSLAAGVLATGIQATDSQATGLQTAGSLTRAGVPRSQGGAVLMIAMVFMLLLSMIAVGVMRSGQMEIIMAGNAQARASAYELAEAMAQSIMANWANTLDTGNIICGTYDADLDPDCDTDLTADLSPALDSYLDPGHADGIAPMSDASFAFLTRYIGEGEPLRGMGTQNSASAFYFDVEVNYDNTSNRQGSSMLVEGAVVINPVSTGASKAPDGDLDKYLNIPI